MDMWLPRGKSTEAIGLQARAFAEGSRLGRADEAQASHPGRAKDLRDAQSDCGAGQIKQVRGFRQFLLGGLEKVQMEWVLVCLTHNILKLHRIICY